MKKKIGIIMDGVVRDISTKFLVYYEREFPNREKPEDEYDIFQMANLFKFDSNDEMSQFILDFGFEIYGKTHLVYNNANIELNKAIGDLGFGKGYEITLYFRNRGRTIPASCFFLSDNGIMADNIKFVGDYSTAWKEMDILVTSSSELIKNKPKNKKAIKFENKFNKSVRAWKKVKTLAELNEIL
jgi:hypothetical protein